MLICIQIAAMEEHCGSTRRAAKLPFLDWIDSSNWTHNVLRFAFTQLKDWLSPSRPRGKGDLAYGLSFGCTGFHNVLSAHHVHGPVLFMKCFSSEMLGLNMESM